MAADRLENSATGKDEVRPLRTDTRVCLPLVEAPTQDRLDDAVDAGTLHPEPVHLPAIVALEAQIDAGKGRHRAGCAQEMEPTAARDMGKPAAAVEPGQHLRDMADHGFEDLRRDVAAPETFSQRHNARGQGCPGHDVISQSGGAMPRQVDQRDLRRTAADIEQDDAVRLARDERAAAGDGQPRLGSSVDDLQFQARRPADTLDEIRPVLGRAAGLRGDHAHTAQSPSVELLRADGERLHGTLHRRLAQAPVCRKPFAQAYDAGERIDDAEAAGSARGGNQQSAIIGAQIKGGVKRFALTRPGQPGSVSLTAADKFGGCRWNIGRKLWRKSALFGAGLGLPHEHAALSPSSAPSLWLRETGRRRNRCRLPSVVHAAPG